MISCDNNKYAYIFILFEIENSSLVILSYSLQNFDKLNDTLAELLPLFEMLAIEGLPTASLGNVIS